MKEEYLKWHSPNLNIDIETLIFGHAGYPVILFPTTKGSYHENKDFKMIDSAKWFLDEGLIKIYCPDSVDALSWYNKSIHPADRGECISTMCPLLRFTNICIYYIICFFIYFILCKASPS